MNDKQKPDQISAINYQEKINWFPGHMHKSLNHLKAIQKNIDLVIEILDARAKKHSANQEIYELFHNKPILKLYLKQDLADCDQDHPNVLNSSDRNIKNQIINLIQPMLVAKMRQMKNKGLIHPIIQVLVCGLPNIGKSTIINKLIGKKVAQAADIPGWTKSFCRYKFYQNMWIYDTPGVFYKHVEKVEVGYILALIGTIKRERIPLKSTLEFAFNYLKRHYFHLLVGLVPTIDQNIEFYQFIVQLTKDRNFWIKHQQLDLEKGMWLFYDLIRSGKIGLISWDH